MTTVVMGSRINEEDEKKCLNGCLMTIKYLYKGTCEERKRDMNFTQNIHTNINNHTVKALPDHSRETNLLMF